VYGLLKLMPRIWRPWSDSMSWRWYCSFLHPSKDFSLSIHTWWSGDVIWRTGKKNFNAVSPQPRAALGVVSTLPAAFPLPKLNRSFRVYHISFYWMNIQVDTTSSNLASAMLNSKIRPRAVAGYGVKTPHPSPTNYVTRSPGCLYNILARLLSNQFQGFYLGLLMDYISAYRQHHNCEIQYHYCD